MFLIVFFPTFAGNFKSYVFYNEYAPTRRTLFRWFHVFWAPGAPPGGTFSCNFCAQARCFVHVASLPSRRQLMQLVFEQKNTHDLNIFFSKTNGRFNLVRRRGVLEPRPKNGVSSCAQARWFVRVAALPCGRQHLPLNFRHKNTYVFDRFFPPLFPVSFKSYVFYNECCTS